VARLTSFSAVLALTALERTASGASTAENGRK
jgi:hypothetical protein